jgi:hypothetical protein
MNKCYKYGHPSFSTYNLNLKINKDLANYMFGKLSRDLFESLIGIRFGGEQKRLCVKALKKEVPLFMQLCKSMKIDDDEAIKEIVLNQSDMLKNWAMAKKKFWRK